MLLLNIEHFGFPKIKNFIKTSINVLNNILYFKPLALIKPANVKI